MTSAVSIDRTAAILDMLASAWLAGAAAVSLALLAPSAALPLAMVGAVLGGGGAFRFLRSVESNPTFQIEQFSIEPTHVVFECAAEELILTLDQRVVPDAAVAPVEELLLTLEHRLQVSRKPAMQSGPELLLEDVLGEIGPESRVVRLFDPALMPTAGQLHSKIERHLEAQKADSYPDAAQALKDALADLRRSLR
ncbi:MAG: hypothetical protein ACJ8EY_02245 [Sphingomicrobium sp.]